MRSMGWVGLIAAMLSASAGATRVAAEAHGTSAPLFNVLFIGNSHLFVNDVPQRVRQRLQVTRGRVHTTVFTRGGARLSSFTQRADVAAALKSRTWDVVVLQEASATFLSPGGAERFARSVAWFRRRLGSDARIVLYQTWPWRDGSRYFAGRASNTRHMWRAMRRAYATVARQPRVTIAPVGTCWMRSPKRATLYSADGNHASAAGSRLAARILAATIARNAPATC